MQIYEFAALLGLLFNEMSERAGIFKSRVLNYRVVLPGYPEKKEKKAGDLHRTATTTYPCCLPALGGFSGSWSCKTCRVQM